MSEGLEVTGNEDQEVMDNRKRAQVVDVLDIISNIEFRRKVGKKKEKLYPIAFELEESILQDMHDTIVEGFGALHVHQESGIRSKFTVRSTDLTTDTYDSLDELVRNVGKDNESIPESLFVEYEVLLYEPYAHRAYVEVDFITDAKLEIEEQGILDYDLASIKIKVGGSDKNWILDTFTRLDKYVKAMKLGGIYKPLLLFRNKYFVWLMSFFTAFIAQTFFGTLVSRWITGENDALKVEDIISKVGIEEKFDTFIRYVYMNKTPLSDSMLVMILGIIAYLIVLVISYIMYPKLIPKSLILLGLSKYKLIKYKNAYKYIVFSVIFLSIIIPLVLSAVFNW